MIFFSFLFLLLYIKWSKESKMSTAGWTQKISYSQSCFNEMIKAMTNTHLSGHRGDFRSSAHSLHCSVKQGAVTEWVQSCRLCHYSLICTWNISYQICFSSTFLHLCLWDQDECVPSIRKRKNIASNQGKKKYKPPKIYNTGFFPFWCECFSVQVFFVI